MKARPCDIADELEELMRVHYSSATIERKQTTTGSEVVKLIFTPQHVFNITVTKARK